MQDETILENRRLIYEYVANNPGTHQRKISRDLDMHYSTLRYHLDYLEEKGVIVSQMENNLKIYFASGKLSADEKRLTTLLQQKRFRDIILVVIDEPGSTSSQISDRLSAKPTTISKYMNILEDRGVLYHVKTGREKRYFINDEKSIIALLMTYKKSFWDSFVNNVLVLYLERD
jgi:predicted transcriptional regulator